MRIPTPKLTQSMARQVRACLSELPDAPTSVRNEMLSIASTLRYLSAELEYGADCDRACAAAAQRLQAQLRSVGLELPADAAQILRSIESPAVPGHKADVAFGALVEYLHTCNQAELGMYRQGLRPKGSKA
jgi:hypothetical protein